MLSPELKSKLGIVRNVPKIDWYRYSGLIATPPKFGKTTLASLIPNSILIACEIGYDSLEMDVRRVKNWEDFVDLIDLLEENITEIGEDIRVAVIDTVHELYAMCNKYMLDKINRKLKAKGKNGVETLAQYDFRNGLVMRDEELKFQLNRLKDLGIQPIFLSHLVKKKIKPEDEESFYSLELDFDENLYNIIVKDVSYILVGQNIKEKDENGNLIVKRKFISKNDGIIQGGSRVHFGEDIYFDTEKEFLDKFQEIFKKTILEKNNLDDKQADKMLKEQTKELIDQRKEHKEESDKKKNLISEIKSKMGSKEVPLATKKKVVNFLFEEYNDKSIEVLNDRSIEELEEILKQF